MNIQENSIRQYKEVFLADRDDQIIHKSGFKNFHRNISLWGEQIYGWRNININSNYISEIIYNEPAKVYIFSGLWDEFNAFFYSKKTKYLIIEKISKKRNKKIPIIISVAQNHYGLLERHANAIPAIPVVMKEFYEVELKTNTVVMSNGNMYNVFISIDF